MGFSPQQLERMLSQLEAGAAPVAAKPQPLGVAPEFFLPADSSYSHAAKTAFTPSPLSPVGGGLDPPTQSPQPASRPIPAEVSVPLVTELPDRTPSPADSSGPPDDFSEFSGKAPRQAALPKGAKNVQCHVIERDPDTGLTSKVYTYSVESSDGA